MIDRKALGARIREARNNAGLSQQQLAVAVGVSDKTISAYEVGRVDPPLEALDNISQATAHPIGFFLGGQESNIEAKLEKIASELQAIRRSFQDSKPASEPTKKSGAWGDPLVSKLSPPRGLPALSALAQVSSVQKPEKVVSYASPDKASSLWQRPVANETESR